MKKKLFKIFVLGTIMTAISCITTAVIVFMSIDMPGSSFDGPLPPIAEIEKQVSKNLKRHIEALATGIGERNYLKPDKLNAAAKYLVDDLTKDGFQPERFTFECQKQKFDDVIVELPGTGKPKEIVVVGAHYDSAYTSPGANDDGSGVAAAMELARMFRNIDHQRTLRFVLFATHEHVFHQLNGVGSYEYAKLCRSKNDQIKAMISLETIGYYTDKPDSQFYPLCMQLNYPDKGNFIAFVSNFRNRDLVRSSIESFRRTTNFPSQGLAAPDMVLPVTLSDHAMFWRFNYPGMMVTDSAFCRYPQYHSSGDKADIIDYDRTARVVVGLSKVIGEMVN